MHANNTEYTDNEVRGRMELFHIITSFVGQKCTYVYDDTHIQTNYLVSNDDIKF